MKKIVESEPKKEETFDPHKVIESKPLPKEEPKPQPKQKDNTILIIAVITIIVVIGLMIYFNYKKSHGSNGTKTA